MPNTIDAPGPYDALEKAKPGEPMFTLLGHDPCAPATITEWCRLRRNLALKQYGEGAAATDKELLAAELRQCANAEEVALEFEEWRNMKEAPSAAGGRATYNAVIKSAEELAEADRRTRREAACQHLREAAYHLGEAKAGLEQLELIGPNTERAMMEMQARVNGIADEYQAKRNEYAAEPFLPIEGA